MELNRVRQRSYEQRFGFLDYEVTTGYASAYYSFRNDFFAQLDVGRYLAGDSGATFSLIREFNNGWKIGAFATKTNVSAVDFGEGAFDKGISVEIPLSWTLGRPNAFSQKATLRPVQRDGGARMNIRNRLYDVIEGTGEPHLSGQWGRFWR
jgi:exopolysaccharide biosynthesis protein YbjH